MRILCQFSTGMTNMILGWKSVCELTENEFIVWYPGQKPAFDAFDESDPSIFILTNPLVSRELQRCFVNRGASTKIIDASEACPGFDLINLKPGAVRPALKSDILFIGGYDDPELLDKFILPLSRKYRLKIVGDTRWPTPSYLGTVDLKTIPDLVASTKLCLTVSEERIPPESVFQYLGLGSIVLSNRGYGLTRLFCENQLPCVEVDEDPIEFAETVDYIVTHIRKKPNWKPTRQNHWGEMYLGGREGVINNHTYFHRIADMLRRVGYIREAEMVMEAHKTIINDRWGREGVGS